MTEREPLIVPKTPDILNKPFVKSLHPFTMMFLSLSYQQGAYRDFSDLQLKRFDEYYTGDLEIRKQKSEKFMLNLAAMIRDGFEILRSNVSEEVIELFPDGILPLFKEKDILHVDYPENEMEKLIFARKKMKSIKLTGQKRSQDSKEKMSMAKIGKSQSQETRDKRSETMRRRWKDQVYWDKMSELSVQNWTRDDYRANQIIKRTGRKLSDEAKEKVRRANTGKIRSPETRKKISETKKGNTQISIDARKKISDSLKGRKRSEETKRRMSEAAVNREAKKRELKVKNVVK